MKKTVMVMAMMTVMNLYINVNDDDDRDDLKGITSVLVIRSIFGHGLLPARGQRLSTPGLFYLTLVKTRQGQDDIQSGSPTLFQEMGWGTNVENKNGYKSIQVSACFRCLPMGEGDTYVEFCLSKDSIGAPQVQIDYPWTVIGQFESRSRGSEDTIGEYQNY